MEIVEIPHKMCITVSFSFLPITFLGSLKASYVFRSGAKVSDMYVKAGENW